MKWYKENVGEWDKEGFENWKNSKAAQSETNQKPSEYSDKELYDLYLEDIENGNDGVVFKPGISGDVYLSDLKDGTPIKLSFTHPMDGDDYTEYGFKKGDGYILYPKENLEKMGVNLSQIQEVKTKGFNIVNK